MKIAFLHLSDIHFHGKDDQIFGLANEIASTCFQSAKSVEAFFIIVTGDIAFSGRGDEYEIASTFLNSIRAAISKEGVPLIDILVVPGNHDCALKPEVMARSLIIDQVIANPSLAENDSIIKICTESQQNFYDFRTQITKTKPVFDDPLFTEYEFLVDSKVIRFSGINAAWMSRIPENPGQLVYPANKYGDVISQPAEFRCVLLHHPLHWYCPNTFHELRTLIGTHACMVLSGHEHVNHVVEVNELSAGPCLYIEADALQPHENGLSQGYSIIELELDDTLTSENIKQLVFKVDGNRITALKTQQVQLDTYERLSSQKTALKREFLKFLSDPGGGFIHPDKEFLGLDDIFVYPELKKKREKDNSSQNNINYSFPAEELLFEDISSLKAIVVGEEKSGKSTLAYQLFKGYHERGFVPLLLNVTEIKSVLGTDIDTLIQSFAKDQYVDPDSFIRAEKSKQVVIVDDFDRAKGGLKAIIKLTNGLLERFESVLFFANSGFEITEIVHKELAETLKVFSTYEITRFGHALRHRLIRKWCLCSPIETLSELDSQIHEIENIVNVVVGRNLVPSKPFYLLILLQSSSNQQQAELKNSSFADYYQYLMTGSLKKSGLKRDQYDELFNYLSNLAWFFREKDVAEASNNELRQFNDTYSELIYKTDLEPRIQLLIDANLLKKRGDHYSFSYPYVYFFFLGRYLAKNLHKPDIKSIVSKWCSELNRTNNAHAILFLTYHVNDPWVINQVAIVLNKCFETLAPIQLNGDIQVINDLVENTTNQLIQFEDNNVEENQAEIRKLRDQSDEAESSEEAREDLVDVGIFREINLFMKTAEILGQIVKNYYGSLERKDKKQLITEVIDAPLRFLRYIFEMIQDDPEGFIIEIEKWVFRKNPELQNANRKIIARDVAFRVLGQISTGILIRASSNISSVRLDDDIRDVVSDNSNTAYKLVAIGTKFVSPKDLPLDEIRRLSLELKSNPFAFGILQSFGALHIHQFHLRIEDKQKLCALLGIQIGNSQVIDYRTKDAKLIKKTIK